MKVIDILNKMAKGEEVPKKIKWINEIYEYCDENKFYYQNGWSMYRDFYTEGNCLNDEVEIIEEEKEIEKIDFRTLNTQKEKNRVMKDTINQLIDVINDMRDKE